MSSAASRGRTGWTRSYDRARPTVAWAPNGVLLRAAVAAGFEVFLTNDSSIEFQQNVERIGIAVIAIVGFRNRMQDLRPIVPRVLESLATIRRGEVITITREPR